LFDNIVKILQQLRTTKKTPVFVANMKVAWIEICGLIASEIFTVHGRAKQEQFYSTV
jgi:hypothetical protein